MELFAMPSMGLSTALSASAACGLLKSAFPGRVVFPFDSEYQAEKEKPWSQNSWLPAACFVRPSDANDIGEVLKIVRETQSRFAVRCAGHNPNPGFSSIGDHGVLIDLQDLKSLDLGHDGILHAGAGNTWGEVYAFLEERGLTAIGGRQRDVGISGYLLGGGMSAFPNIHGMAADNVKNHEIVLADSTVVTANANDNADLYRALKGGGANFGIVTRFDIETYDITTQYTLLMYDPSGIDEVLRATIEAQEAMETDPKIGMVASVYSAYIVVALFYADAEAELPKVFETFNKLGSLTSVAVPSTKGTIKSLVDAFGPVPPPTRRLASSASTRVSYELYKDVHQLWLHTIEKYSEAANISYNIQPVSTILALIGEEKGGNSLGIDKAPQTWWALVSEWPNQDNDMAASQGLDLFQEGITKLAKERGHHLDFLFMNDAKFSQNVLGSYGQTNAKTFREVAAKYDPEEVFQKLQHDGFLLRNI